MTCLLVDNVREDSLARLKTRATLQGHSLQAELKSILEAAAMAPPAALAGWSENLPVPMEDPESDSLALLEASLEVAPSPRQFWLAGWQPYNSEQD